MTVAGLFVAPPFNNIRKAIDISKGLLGIKNSRLVWAFDEIPINFFRNFLSTVLFDKSFLLLKLNYADF